MANAFHGVPDRLRLARAVRAALKPTGRFAIVNWHQRPRQETSPEQTIEAVDAGNLKLVRLAELPPYHYGAVFTPPPV
jgi:hypothetical protein